MPDRHLIRASALFAALLACLAPDRSVAQSTTTLLPDATVLPRAGFRVRLLTSFTRYDEFLGDGGKRNIGSLFATDSLGTAQMPRLAPIETDVQAASGLANFRLTAGNVVSIANSRVMTFPLILEYGLTSRLTVGVAVPLVETRTTLFAQLNPRRGTSNVGSNPALLTGSDAVTRNASLVQSMRAAADTLQAQLTQCIAMPSGAGCAPILADQVGVQQLLQNSQAMASAVASLYGTDRITNPGREFVPLDSSAAQLAVTARINAIAAGYRTFLGRDPILGAAVGAAGPGANAELQRLLESVGRDTVQSTDRASIGDISVGVTYQLANSFPLRSDTTSVDGVRYRVALNGTFRIGTGQPANRNRMFDIGTGYGQHGIEGGIATDFWLGNRWSATALGYYTVQLGTVDINRVPHTGNVIYPLTNAFSGTFSAGNVAQFVIKPRYRLAGFLALTAHYSFLRIEGDTYTLGPVIEPIDPPIPAVVPDPAPIAPFGTAAQTMQQVGVGFSYSTQIGRERGPGAIPVEILFSHIETIAGSGGPVVKAFRDQIEMRVFFGRR